MLDTHTHILPQMDDGSKSVRQSIRQLRREAKQRISNVLLTPHFYASKEAPEAFFARRDESFAALKAGMADTEGLPRLHLGAEVTYFNGISRVEGLSRFCISGTETK